jgi:hypothetical protein
MAENDAEDQGSTYGDESPAPIVLNVTSGDQDTKSRSGFLQNLGSYSAAALVAITAIYTLISGCTLSSLQNDFVTGEQPVIGVTAVGAPSYDAARKWITASVRVKNAGKSAAYSVTMSPQLWLQGNPAMDQIDAFFSQQPLLEPAAGKQFTIVLPGEGVGELAWHKTSKTDADSAMTTDDHVYLAVRVWYRDQFKRPYSVDYCGAWYPGLIKSWTDCLRHNEVHEPTK